MRAKNTQCSTRSNSRIETRKIQASDSTVSRVVETARLRAREILRTKYSRCQNSSILSSINTAIITGKQCPLRATIRDIEIDLPLQKLQLYYTFNKSQFQLRDLIDYYRFYEQRAVIFIKEFFLMVFEYQQRRKVVQYKRLKVLLDLTDSDDQEISKCGGYETKFMNCDLLDTEMSLAQRDKNTQKSRQKNKFGYRGVNVLDDINLSQFSSQFENQNQETVLIKSLRNKLSNHIGKTIVKNLSIQKLDRFFNFQKIDQNFHPKKQPFNLYFTQNPKNKHFRNQAKVSLPQSCSGYPEKDRKILRRNNKKNSCEILTKKSLQNGPVDRCVNKVRTKKNLSIDRISITKLSSDNTSRKFFNFKFKKNNQQQTNKNQEMTKNVKAQWIFIESINHLKTKIQKEKEKLKEKKFTNKPTVKKQINKQYIVSNTRKNNPEQIKKINRKIPRKIRKLSKQKKLN